MPDRREPALSSEKLAKRRLITTACLLAQFMAAVESTIVGTAMPTIVAALGDFHLFSWVFVVYLLFQAVSVPIYGRLADRPLLPGDPAERAKANFWVYVGAIFSCHTKDRARW